MINVIQFPKLKITKKQKVKANILVRLAKMIINIPLAFIFALASGLFFFGFFMVAITWECYAENKFIWSKG